MVCIVMPVFEYNYVSVEYCFEGWLTHVVRLRHNHYQICLFTVAKLKIVKPDYLNISTTVSVSKILLKLAIYI